MSVFSDEEPELNATKMRERFLNATKMRERFLDLCSLHILTAATKGSTSGGWYISFGEIQELVSREEMHFNVGAEKENIKDRLTYNFGEAIAEIDVEDDGFDVTLWTNFVHEYDCTDDDIYYDDEEVSADD